MAIEWGLTAVLVKLISLVRGRNRSVYFNNKRDEVVYTLAEKLNDTKFLLRTHPHTEKEHFEEISPKAKINKTPYIKFNQVGSKEYETLLKPVYYKMPVCLSEHLYNWNDLSKIVNNIYLTTDVKKAIHDLNFSDDTNTPQPSGKIPVNHLLLSLSENIMDDKFFILSLSFEEYYNRLFQLKRSLIKATRGKLKLN